MTDKSKSTPWHHRNVELPNEEYTWTPPASVPAPDVKVVTFGVSVKGSNQGIDKITSTTPAKSND